MSKENYYDEQIAPKLKELEKDCEINGISLLAVCEWGTWRNGLNANITERKRGWALR